MPVVHKKFLNIVRPVFVKRAFCQKFVSLFFAFGINGYPYRLALHAYNIAVNNVFVDEVVYVGAVWRNKVHKLFIHNKVDYGLILFHTPVLFNDAQASLPASRQAISLLQCPVNLFVGPFCTVGGGYTYVVIGITFHHTILFKNFEQHLAVLPGMLLIKILLLFVT